MVNQITLSSAELKPLIPLSDVLRHLHCNKRYFRNNYEQDFPKPVLAPSREVRLYSLVEFETYLADKAKKFGH